MMIQKIKLKPGDTVYCCDDDKYYYIQEVCKKRKGWVELMEAMNSRIQDPTRKPIYRHIRSLYKDVYGTPRPVCANISQESDVKEEQEAPDPAYNWRKDLANTLFWSRYKSIVNTSPKHVYALLLDAPPRGFPEKLPNSTDFLIHKEGVLPQNIVVINPCAQITSTLKGLGVQAHQTLLNEYVAQTRPDTPFNYLYLDACGSYEKQVRDALQSMLENHKRWIANETILNIVVCKRNGKGVPDKIRLDLDKWSREYAFGHVLFWPVDVDNPKMHSVTCFLKRH